jgi:hypothetical protein
LIVRPVCHNPFSWTIVHSGETGLLTRIDLWRRDRRAATMDAQ